MTKGKSMQTMNRAGRRRNAGSNTTRAMAIVMLAGPVLAACQTMSPNMGYHQGSALTYQQRHPIVVGFRPVSASLTADAYAGGLSAVDQTEVAAVARQYRNSGYGPIWVQTPPPGGHDHAVQASVHQIRQIVSREGVDASAVQVRSYPSLAVHDPQGSPMRIVFNRYSAEAGPCGDWPSNVAHNPNNDEYHNFGCATQRAMAAQVDDPRDLLGPRGQGDRNPVRRSDVFEKYQRGEITASATDGAAQATVSEVAE